MNVRIEISETGVSTAAASGAVVAEAGTPMTAGPPQGLDVPEHAGAIDGGVPSAALMAAVAAAGGLSPQPALAGTNGVATNAGPAPS